MPQSAELTAFYRAYAKWLDDGAPHWGPYGRNMGLCAGLYDTCYSNGWGASEKTLQNEMRRQFFDAGLSPSYPFNNDSFQEYRNESYRKRTHLNPKRIQWVREHC